MTVIISLIINVSISAQQNTELENRIGTYLQEQDPKKQYDILSDLIEFNSSVSLEEAAHYMSLYNTPSYKNKDGRYPVLAHFIAADVLYFNELKDSSLFHYMSQANLAKEIKHNMLASSGVGNASFVLSELGDKVGALNLLKQNRDINANTGDVRDIADHTYNIASYYTDIGIPDSAIYYFEKTLDVDTRSNNKSGMLYDMQVLLSNYIINGNLAKAKDLCEQCIRISEELEERKALAKCYFYKADTYFNSNEPKEAEEAILKAIEIDQDRNDPTRIGKYYKVYALILTLKKDYQKANENYLLALEYAEKGEFKTDITSASLSYAEFLIKTGKAKEAMPYVERADELINNHELNKFRQQLYEKYSLLYKAQNNFEKALEYKEKEAEYLSKLNASQLLQATDQSKNAFDLFKMENENRVLSTEKELQVAKTKRRNNLLIFSSLLFLLLLGLSWFAFQNQKQKNLLFKQKAKEEAVEMEYRVLEKEMTALRSQMNPHFLFNSLSSINDYIMHEEPRLASKYLTKFSQLMRTILNNSKEKLVSLEDEMKAIDLYIEMENLRFKEKFEYQKTIDPSINIQSIFIPSMLIQPYIENAIKHGLRNSKEEGILILKITESKGELHIRVEDNGIGRVEAMKLKSVAGPIRKSHGMRITSDRIKLLNKIHDIDAKIEITDKVNPSGTEVCLRIKLITQREGND